MAQVRVVLEEKIAAASVCVERKTLEVVGNCSEKPGMFTSFGCLNGLFSYCVLCYVLMCDPSLPW
jgi:hypothetical protein